MFLETCRNVSVLKLGFLENNAFLIWNLLLYFLSLHQKTETKETEIKKNKQYQYNNI